MSGLLSDNDDVMNALMRALCDPGFVTPRAPLESLQSWQRRAIVEHAAPHIAAAVAEEFRGPIVWLIGLQDAMHKVYANQPDWDRLRENLNKACLDLTSLLPENQPGAES